MDIVKAERATVRFFDGLEIDGYRMPDGEFRVSMAGASILLGYQRNWLSRNVMRGGTTLKALQGRGFSGQTQETGNPMMSGGVGVVLTISLRDFNTLIHFAAGKDKPQAIALQSALTDMALTDFFRDAFGMRALSIEEKRDRLYQAFAATLTAADWQAWDREDALGIDSHLKFLGEG